MIKCELGQMKVQFITELSTNPDYRWIRGLIGVAWIELLFLTVNDSGNTVNAPTEVVAH